ncbi:acyl-CoA dehydrogenase family protein [Wenjunlia tyrosinilytica]|uniref:Acyl-CoA dehydrogenase n=1 Tax=Wenjunlia tyrosinilytica TaxID=1544741 RepID=A0A918DZ07_9ACTN|nr:acyl-CoA dehydrogenase family protein [Wenjunlia tyrosinilytica]GGO92430.1 acyl-CoA dehydrogenase [Wenjunlia tyrosinilytica]
MTITETPVCGASGTGAEWVGARAEELERLLGDPRDPDSPFGFAAAVARDEHDRFPTELVHALRGTGFHLNYLPAELGGTFRSFAHSLVLVRTAARRDLNVMPGTMFGITAATCLMLHGSPEQQRRAAGILRRGGAVAFALSEADHGSDLLANTARLDRDPDSDGWRLTGRKWMVGLGQRCEAAYLVARTGQRGPAAFSAVLLDLGGAADKHLERGPDVRTGGMRGIDFADLDFNDFPVPADALVGREGEALEAAVKAQQVVRVMSTAGSLGCADTALRLTLDFATGRRVGRTPLTEAPHPRRDLAVASAALIAADAVAMAAARGLHVVPETFSVWGCAAKHVVAEAAEDVIGRCATVLATRSVLRTGGPGAGLFQKLQRDAALVRVVDTSTVANLRSFAGQLPAVAAAAHAGGEEWQHGRGGQDGTLRTVFALDAELPAYDPAALDLNARGHDPVTAGLGRLVTFARRSLSDGGASETAALVDRLGDDVSRLSGDIERARSGGDPCELVDLAERFAFLHAAACCLHLWWANRHLSLVGWAERHPALYGTAPGSPEWLGAALAYLLAKADGTDPRRQAAMLLPALDVITDLHGTDRLFSAVPVRLARHADLDADFDADSPARNPGT